ncbi:MAG TPA: hypothetical protein VHV82_15490 [Sporichthyaceae bacterium]|nr:hypothetical protein [Sporichthyaceae bacterium]
MSTYQVRCAWENGSWLVTGLGAGCDIRSRCTRLTQAQDRFAEAVHRSTGEPMAAIRVEIAEVTGLAQFKDLVVVTDEPSPLGAALAELKLRTPIPPGTVRQTGAPAGRRLRELSEPILHRW